MNNARYLVGSLSVLLLATHAVLGASGSGASALQALDVEACCLSNGECRTADPLCCALLGGTSHPGGACSAMQGGCLPDAETCLAGCVPVDAFCCVAQSGGTPMGTGTACDQASDDDGVHDLCDIFPGIDDAVFCPECQNLIPTVSQWGIVVFVLCVLVVAKIQFARPRQ